MTTKNYEIINTLKKITKEKNKLKTLYYFLIMISFRPYYNKHNCGFLWHGGELFSEIFDSAFLLSNKLKESKEIDPSIWLKLVSLNKKISDNNFIYELPMMVHFALHYHHRALLDEPSEEDNINFLCSQIPKHKRTHVKNAYFVLQELKLTDKGNSPIFNPKQVEWDKIVKKEKV